MADPMVDPGLPGRPGLFARSPLADRAGDLAAAGAREAAFLAQVDLRVDASSAGRSPVELPTTPNRWLATGAREALWLGPDEWLVVAPPGSAPAVVAELEGALDGVHRSVVDVSANRAVVELADPEHSLRPRSGVRGVGGQARFGLLTQGCALDLHPRAWRAGMCAQTLLARTPVILQEREGATRVFVRSSLAGYLADWLGRARLQDP